MIAVVVACYNPVPAAKRPLLLGSKLWREDGSSRCRLERRQVRPDVSARSVVAFADGGFSRIQRVHRLLHVGGLAEQLLHLRPLHFTVLFSGTLRQLAARHVRPQTALVSELSARSLRRFLSSGSPASSASPVTTTAARTTNPSGPIPRPARSASRARRISANEASRSSCRISIATSCASPTSSGPSWFTTLSSPSASPTASASASEASFSS